MTFPHYKLLHQLLRTRDRILLRLALQIEIVEEVARILGRSDGYLDYYKAGDLN
jgi:hypothetical protein